MSDEKFGDDFGDAAPRSAARPGKKKKKGQPSKSGKAPTARSKSQPEEGGKKPSQLVAAIVLILFMVPVIGFAIFMAVRQTRMQKASESAFAAEIDQLLQPPKDGVAPPGKPGKFAEVDVVKRELYVYHGNLGDDMRATSPAEADYIVQVNETRETVAEYTDGSKGIKVTLEVHVDDVPGGVISHSASETDAVGRTVRRSTLELLDYAIGGQEQSPDPAVRRRFHRSRPRRKG